MHVFIMIIGCMYIVYMVNCNSYNKMGRMRRYTINDYIGKVVTKFLVAFLADHKVLQFSDYFLSILYDLSL